MVDKDQDQRLDEWNQNIWELICAWFLYKMVAHFTMRKYGVKQKFQFVIGIWLHRKSSEIPFVSREKNLFYIIRAYSEMSNHLIKKPCSGPQILGCLQPSSTLPYSSQGGTFCS